jgi:hypothetical protein
MSSIYYSGWASLEGDIAIKHRRLDAKMTVMQQQTSLRKSGLSYDKFSLEIWSRAYKLFCFYIPLFERWIMQIPGPSIVFFFFQGKMKFSPSAMCVCVCDGLKKSGHTETLKKE